MRVSSSIVSGGSAKSAISKFVIALLLLLLTSYVVLNLNLSIDTSDTRDRIIIMANGDAGDLVGSDKTSILVSNDKGVLSDSNSAKSEKASEVTDAQVQMQQIKLRKQQQQLTIRVNTFRRNDLITDFISYYQSCPVVKEIQVVWSDTEAKPPKTLTSLYEPSSSSSRTTAVMEEKSSSSSYSHPNAPKKQHAATVHFEIHDKNSLANRFKPLLDISTDAVLSIDDDLIVPCNYLGDMLDVWISNPRVLVGNSPRMHGYDPNTGSTRYMRWQHTWWSGTYSIMLTKIAILHKKYLHQFNKEIPETVVNFIDKNRNCEDLAMAHIIASTSKAAPVWSNGLVYEVGQTGISSGASHFVDRGHCLEFFRDSLGDWPWVNGMQKMIKMAPIVGNFFSLWR